MARFGSGLFLIIQMIILLDFTQSWNDDWAEKVGARSGGCNPGARRRAAQAPHASWAAGGWVIAASGPCLSPPPPTHTHTLGCGAG